MLHFALKLLGIFFGLTFSGGRARSRLRGSSPRERTLVFLVARGRCSTSGASSWNGSVPARSGPTPGSRTPWTTGSPWWGTSRRRRAGDARRLGCRHVAEPSRLVASGSGGRRAMWGGPPGPTDAAKCCAGGRGCREDRGANGPALRFVSVKVRLPESAVELPLRAETQ